MKVRTPLDLAAFLALLALGAAAPAATAQEGSENGPAKDDEKRIAEVEKLLDQVIKIEPLVDEQMPLGKACKVLEKHFLKDKGVALRIDAEAFGKELAEIEMTPAELPAYPKKMALGLALRLMLRQAVQPVDYKVGARSIVFTTPERALVSRTYDVRDLATKRPGFFAEVSRLHRWPSVRLPQDIRDEDGAFLLARFLVQKVAEDKWRATRAPWTIRVLNGTRFLVSANVPGHGEIAGFLSALRRLDDLTLVLNAQLFEVDDAFYRQLKNVKRVPLEELDRQLLAGIPAEGDALHKILDRQKPILVGDEVAAADGAKVVLLSRHKVITCLPTPDQVRLGAKDLNTILEGFSFQAGIRVSADRRSVRLSFTEKTTQVREIQKVKVEWGLGVPNKMDAEVPFVEESSFTRSLEIPDGGSILVRVRYRPPSARAKDRWWVLRIRPRIVIKEEEEMNRADQLEGILPVLVADVLTNQRLKASREFYGTSGDKRFALVGSEALTLPKSFHAAVPGYQQVGAKREGNRLLGIRVDKFQELQKDNAGPILLVTLFNAGGSANGAVVGGCTVRYGARSKEKGWTVELAEPLDP
jgi:hypothetical protein